MASAGCSLGLLAPLALVVFSAALAQAFADCTFDFHDCMELYPLKVNTSDVYIIGSDDNYNRVYCYNDEDEAEGGGWTGVLRQNQTGIETVWEPETNDNGSGSLYGNFWIGSTALAQMTDEDMTLVVRAQSTTGDWQVGLFRQFNVGNNRLSPEMVYVDGNIGLEKSDYQDIEVTNSCLGYWWLPDCQPSVQGPSGGAPSAVFTSVEVSIRPTVNDTQRACPPLFPFSRDTTKLNMIATYSEFWRAAGGTVNVSCINQGELLLWSQEEAQSLMRGDASAVTGSQTFTCQLSGSDYKWSPEREEIPGGPRCLPPCDSGYGSNLETGNLHACLKFVEASDASNLQKAWEVCQGENASLANPFTTNGTLETFKTAAMNSSVYTSVDKRNEGGIISAGLVNSTLLPASISSSNDCIFFDGSEFVSQPCFPKGPTVAVGAVCQRPRVCPEGFLSHPEWGCYIRMKLDGEERDTMTPSKASLECAMEYGASLPPHTGGLAAITYISTVNRRGDGITWRDADGAEVTLQPDQAANLSRQCLSVHPTAADLSVAIACDEPLDITVTDPSIMCVYPRRKDCYSDPPSSTSDSRALNAEAPATCPEGLVFNMTGDSSVTLTCHGALGNWLPALGDCVARCGPPPPAPENSVRHPEEASNQTWYTYTCPEGLLTDAGGRESTVICQSSGEYEPPLPANCSRCGMFPALDETMVMEQETIFSGTQGQTVEVQCATNMTTADGRLSQNVTCGPAGWTPSRLSLCNVCGDAPLVDNTTVTVEMPQNQSLGSVILYSCSAGKAFSFGANLTSAICLPGGWTTCHEELSCPVCVDEPPAPLDYMNRTWSDLDQTANYTCDAHLTLDGHNNTQSLDCQTEGWTQTLLPCDKCETPNATNPDFFVSWNDLQLGNSTLTLTCPPGKVHENLMAWQQFPCTAAGWQSDNPLPCDRCGAPTIRPGSNAFPTSTEAGVREDETLTFNCTAGLVTGEGHASFTETCREAGWSATQSCSHCAGDPPAQNLSIARVWTEDRTLEAVATYNCSSGDQLTVVCELSGWSSLVDPCDLQPLHCSAPPTATYNNTELEDTGKGTEPNRTATYRCPNGVTSVLRCLEDGTWSGEPTPCAAPGNMCPAPPAAPEGATVEDSSVFSSGQRNATYTCSDGTRALLYCVNATWTEGIRPCEPGSPQAPPPPPPGVFVVTDSGLVVDENGIATQTLTYDCDTGVKTLTWRDGVWTPENAMPCADLSNACPERDASRTNVTFVDTGPYTDGVRNATYNCSGAGLPDTFSCLNGSWSPDLEPCDASFRADPEPSPSLNNRPGTLIPDSLTRSGHTNPCPPALSVVSDSSLNIHPCPPPPPGLPACPPSLPMPAADQRRLHVRSAPIAAAHIRHVLSCRRWLPRPPPGHARADRL